MRKGVIVYKSKYGSTKKYVDWLSRVSGFDSVEVKKASLAQLQPYDTIIFGGGIYASGIAGFSFLKKNIESLRAKDILVFCVGASPYDEKAIEQIYSHNFKSSLSGIPFFYCRGAWDLESMGFVDRNLCKMLQKMVAKKNSSEYELWEMALMQAGNEKCDWTDEKYLEPIIEYLGL